ncbi:methyltransferase domain-containing protein [Dyella sp. C9]|uniref:methyltransferase domain-containing protein n=1 Tax=Dyella sp. C9 TaxID=2202154 RepID=UPI000DEF422F|nr:class I SAM-dependent methyltransferase [Dyella sp. C9]
MQSQLCTQEKLTSGLYQDWARVFGLGNHIHRKTWEWVFICEALHSSGMLKPGKVGLGFAVGKEPLASVFASRGAQILATDLELAHATQKGWLDNNEHAANKAALNERKLCDELEFNRLVNFRSVDMNRIPREFDGKFDFNWSSCAFEHLGSIQHGIDFVCNSMRALKPGGVAVHTTEFNVCSNQDTIESGDTVIYRRRDIEALIDKLTSKGYLVEEMDWSYGTSPLDYCVDVPPYKHNPHLKLLLAGYVCTSIGLIVRKRP